MWIFALYTMVDGMFVAWGVGERALASVNLSMPYVICIFSIGLLMATGTSTLISIALGQKKEEEASSLFSMNLVVLTIVSLVVTVLTFLFLEPLAVFLGASPDNLAYVKSYVGTIGAFAVFFILSYNMEALVKTDGTPVVSTIGVMVCGLTNVILDYVFVMVFHWGVWGAAFATGLAQVASTIIFFTYFARFRKKLCFRRFKWNPGVYKKIIPLGLANGFTELSGGLVVFLFNQIILRVIGESGIVSYTVISYINTLVLNTMAGIAQGTQPLISFYYGKGDEASCSKLLRYSVRASVGMAAAAFLAAMAGADMLVGVFISPSLQELRDYSAFVFRIFSISFLFMGFNVVAGGFFTAIEKPGESLMISLGRGVVTMVSALGACIALMGGAGIWWAPTVSELTCLAGYGCADVPLGEILINNQKNRDAAQ